MVRIFHRFTGAVLREVDSANLWGANLWGANLWGANLWGADLHDAGLHDADLHDADLHDANLHGADLRGANLCGANLCRANLRRANLRRANLCGANLCGANLWGADLHDADLRRAYLPAPTMMLLASWGRVSDQLTADLMLWDSVNHPDPERFEIWARGGQCPYNDVRVQRAANFIEKARLWGQGRPRCPYDLMIRLLTEKTATFVDKAPTA